MKKLNHNLLSGLLAPVLIVTIIGCGAGGESAMSEADALPPTSTLGISTEPPSLDEVANATFAGIMDDPVSLIDGHWQGDPFVEGGASAPAVGLVRGFHLTGDVTGDGKANIVVLLWSSSGGSGTFDYISVVGRTETGVASLATAVLGDRIQVRQGRIVDGRIELDVVQAGPEDAACCPTQMATRIWQMSPGELSEVSSEVTGTISLADLQGAEWVLTDFAWNEPAPEDPEVTLLFEEDKISGNAGCNGYFGGFEEAGDLPSGLAFGPLGATRKMCPEEMMTVEDRFLKQLGSVTSYSYLAGKLALSWQSEDGAGVMLFVPRIPVS
jgi:heat shock protein HslJ